VDGTDPLQVYEACRQAVARAHAGGGPTIIEAKLMRMKGHAIHDPASYVPPRLLEFWRRRDPIVRFEGYLTLKGWLGESERTRLRAEIEVEMAAERAAAESSPMPTPDDVLEGVYCERCHHPTPHFQGRPS